ncbi:MAG: hypothetical protein M3Y87_10965 [Myxococcota bacterium]|nr:hypothetical protein [Myxococcota bacterium]
MSASAGRTWLVIALIAMLASGCDSILGAECADGFEICDGRCVLIGTCDDALDGGIDGSIDAGDADLDRDADVPLDAPRDDGSPGDAGDGSTGDAGRGDASLPPGCDLGEILCDDLCVDGRSDPDHCGGCGIECAAGEVCSAGVCAPTCIPPLVLCDGLCIDVSSDPDNCGACGVVCASGICIDGECSDALASHVVALGHDYEMRRPGMNRLAGNALFLARGSPVRALMYEGGSTMATRVGTDAAIQQVATAIGRTWTRTAVSDPSKVTLELADADAFVIYAQTTATDAELRDLGVLWGRALDSFIRRGGVVVMFETMAAGHAGTWQILDAAELFECSGRSDISGATITVVDPADSVALRVPLAYMGERTTVRFDTAESNVVSSDGTGPVVVHRTIVP